MIVQCEGCSTRFRIADEKVTPKGVRVRCTKCKATFVVRPQAEASAARGPDGGKAALTAKPRVSPPPEGSASREELLPPPPLSSKVETAPDTGAVIGGGSADPLSLVQIASEGGANFDLDALLGKDFDLDLPQTPPAPPPAAFEPPAEEEPKRSPSVAWDDGGTGDSTAAPPIPAPESAGHDASDSDFDSPDFSLFDADSPDASLDAPPPFPGGEAKLREEPSEHYEPKPELAAAEAEADLSSSLFDGMDLGDGPADDAESRSLTSLFDGDLDREDSPNPTEEDVDAALAAFDSAFDVSVEEDEAPAKEPAPMEAQRAEPEPEAEEDARPAPQVPAPMWSGGEPDHDGQSEGEGWVDVGGIQLDQPSDRGEPASLFGQDADDPFSSSAPLQADPGEAGEPSLFPGAGDAPGLGDFDLNLDDVPGVTLGGSAPAPAGGSSGALDFNLDDAPPVALGSSSDSTEEKSDSSVAFDADDADPFADLGGLESTGGGEDFFGSLDDLSGESDPDQVEAAPPPSQGQAKPVGRIELISSQEAAGPRASTDKKPSAEGEKSARRRVPVVALMANGVFTLALAGVALLAFVVFRTGGPLDASLLSSERVLQAFAPRTAAGPVVRVLSSGAYTTRSGDQLVLVRGTIVNLTETGTVVAGLGIEGRLLDGDGNVLRSAPGTIGEAPTSEDLWRISGASDVERLRRRLGRRAGRAEQGDGVDFFILFEGGGDPLPLLRFEAVLVGEGSGGATGTARDGASGR